MFLLDRNYHKCLRLIQNIEATMKRHSQRRAPRNTSESKKNDEIGEFQAKRNIEGG